MTDHPCPCHLFSSQPKGQTLFSLLGLQRQQNGLGTGNHTWMKYPEKEGSRAARWQQIHVDSVGFVELSWCPYLRGDKERVLACFRTVKKWGPGFCLPASWEQPLLCPWVKPSRAYVNVHLHKLGNENAPSLVNVGVQTSIKIRCAQIVLCFKNTLKSFFFF